MDGRKAMSASCARTKATASASVKRPVTKPCPVSNRGGSASLKPTTTNSNGRPRAAASRAQAKRTS
ncbi:hypothetical protein D3C72_2395990 [compost metagenome]